MKTKTSTRIEPGELTLHRGKLYRCATAIAGRPCHTQCSIFDFNSQRCDGFCWRWDNPDGLVFRFILPEVMVKDATEVVSTPDLISDKLRRLDKEAFVRRRRKQTGSDGTGKRGPKARGNIEERSTGYRGSITIGGVRYRYSDASRDAVEQWLEEMKENDKN